MAATLPSPPLSSRATRVLAELCAAGVPVTVVAIGSAAVVQGRVSFAHGGRAAVVSRGDCTGFGAGSGQVVLTALWTDRAVSLTGRVREVGTQSVSLELFGDLKGSDPRRHPRAVVTRDQTVTLTAGAHATTGRLRDVSERGLSLLVEQQEGFPPVGATVQVSTRPESAPLEGLVRHCTRGADGAGRVRLGLGFPAGADARSLLDDRSAPPD